MNLFIKIFLTVIVVSIMGSIPADAETNESPRNSHPATDLVDDWQLAMQFWTFNKISFFEAMDRTAELGISWVEAYPGQKLYADRDDVVFDHMLATEHRDKIRKEMKRKGLRLVNYGVVNLPGDSLQCRQIFDFARDMGIKTLVAEPEMKDMAMIDHLCQEYDINMAIHNHPKPSRYWNPDTVLKACEGRSAYIGACGDVGHWFRSRIQSLMGLQKLKDRLITVHMKDVADYGNPKASDVLWGRGGTDIDLLIEELRNIKFKGTISIEYERQTPNLMAELRQNINAYNMIAAAMRRPDWYFLLAPDLANAIFEKDSWEFKDGILSAQGGGDLWTKEVFGNFILDLEFKLAPETNSGIFLRTGNIEEWLHTAIEVQLMDSYGIEKAGKHDCGAIFDCLEPAKINVNPAGQWNRYTITCTGNKIYVVLNGEQVIDMDLDKWTEAGKNPDGTDNKFKTAYKDMPRIGHLGFQYHGQPVWFRNIRIRQLDVRGAGK